MSDEVAKQLYEAALPLACVVGNAANYCASCGRWGGNDFDGRDEHDEDCELYLALKAYRAATGTGRAHG